MRSQINNSSLSFTRISKHWKTMDKNTRAARSCFQHYFLVFGYPCETLALVVHIYYKKCMQILKEQFTTNDFDHKTWWILGPSVSLPSSNYQKVYYIQMIYISSPAFLRRASANAEDMTKWKQFQCHHFWYSQKTAKKLDDVMDAVFVIKSIYYVCYLEYPEQYFNSFLFVRRSVFRVLDRVKVTT
mgnify:CR=1 FL=1